MYMNIHICTFALVVLITIMYYQIKCHYDVAMKWEINLINLKLLLILIIKIKLLRPNNRVAEISPYLQYK